MAASGSNNQQDTAANSGAERRVRTHLRIVFEDACGITAPFFERDKIWGGVPLTLFAHQTLRAAYPDLTQQDIALLFAAVQRFHGSAEGVSSGFPPA